MMAPPTPSTISKAAPAADPGTAPTMKMQTAVPTSPSGSSTVKLSAAPVSGGQTMAMPTMQLPVQSSGSSVLDVVLSGLAMACSGAAAGVLYFIFQQ